MDAGSWFDTRPCGNRIHGGAEGGSLALDIRRHAAARRVLDRDDPLRTRMLERDASSAAVLAERDLGDVDYAGGSGY